jgi:flavin reductase (DIM6/NTAB) family NADH-FMN oxidoreductase RutF
MIVIDPLTTEAKNIYKLLIGCIVPRPIAFVSSKNSNGILNLAPFSFFMGVCANPPTLAFSVSQKGNGGGTKDTLATIRETKEFVVNVVTEEMGERMNVTAAEFPPEINEFTIAGFTAVASEKIAVPRVKESPIHMECRVSQIVEINASQQLGASVVFGEIICFHLAEEIYDNNFHIDIAALHPIGRLAGNGYSRTDSTFDLVRPKMDDILRDIQNKA